MSRPHQTTSTSTTSGVDLARVALRNARAAAKTAPQKTRRTGAATPSRQARSGGREPQTLGTAITRMVAERGLEAGATAGSVRRTVLCQWQHVAPELAGKVQAVRYDDATRTLHLRPCSPAYRTQLTLHQRQIVARVNAAAATRAPWPAWRSRRRVYRILKNGPRLTRASGWLRPLPPGRLRITRLGLGRRIRATSRP